MGQEDSQPIPVPTSIKLHNIYRYLENTYPNDDVINLPCEYLRVFSPAAEEKSDGMGSALLDLDNQTKVLDGYLADLRISIDAEMKGRERLGMLMVQQIMEQLYPHIVAGEIDLDETMIIDIVQDSGINFDHFTGNA